MAFKLGALLVEGRTMQEAVDAAAFGGSVVLFNGGTNAAAVSAATTDLSLNGYSASNLMLTIVSPPTSGTYAYNVDYVAVTASRRGETPPPPPAGGATPGGRSATARARRQGHNLPLHRHIPPPTDALP